MGVRGRRPKSLTRLFWLLRENPHLSNAELAQKLGVKPRTVSHYRWDLKRISQSSMIAKYPCPECYTFSVVQVGGDLVCQRCGLTVEEAAAAVHRLPFGETYAWVSHLAFGKSLGDTLPANRLHEVLARSPAGRRNLASRLRAVRGVSNAVDPPTVKRLLELGSRMMKDLGLDADTVRNHLIADELGRRLRRLGNIIQAGLVDAYLPGVAAATLYVTLLRLHPSVSEEARRRFPFNEGHYLFAILPEQARRRA
ncbi:MAG: winged helix-turn-helix domain-containing protein [Candidatus Bathyarchaeia archaeon]